MTPWPIDYRKVNQEYIESDRWKCNESPTRAHHWIILNKIGHCKYCGLHKNYDTLEYWK